MLKIAVLDRCTVTNGDISFAPMEAVGKVIYYDVLPPAEIPAAIGDCDAVVVNKARIAAQIMDACPNLKFIGLFATGYNNIDTAAAARRGIVVCNVPGYSTQSVAQHTFALMLHFASRVDEYAASVARGDWANASTFSYLSFPSHELCGRTLAIYGYGNIGRKVADIGRAFGMKVIATVHSPRPAEDGVEFVDVNELFSRADYLSQHCPLTEETRHLVSAQTLSLMKPTAYIINTARGGVIEEDALCDALNSGRLAGAGIDVLDIEPMRPGHPYLTAKNCYITPHVAWASIEARTRLMNICVNNIKGFIDGKPVNLVN
jgi:glycerate dehydrogenase